MSAWINQIFKAGAVAKGNVVRRDKNSVAEYASRAELLKEVRKRRFHLIETGDQYVIVCNRGVLRLHC